MYTKSRIFIFLIFGCSSIAAEQPAKTSLNLHQLAAAPTKSCNCPLMTDEEALWLDQKIKQTVFEIDNQMKRLVALHSTSLNVSSVESFNSSKEKLEHLEGKLKIMLVVHNAINNQTSEYCEVRDRAQVLLAKLSEKPEVQAAAHQRKKRVEEITATLKQNNDSDDFVTTLFAPKLERIKDEFEAYGNEAMVVSELMQKELINCLHSHGQKVSEEAAVEINESNSVCVKAVGVAAFLHELRIKNISGNQRK